ncbi:MAG: aminotransferase class III-fold pyridoxal phosphate-dependent enzyme, partial [Planctomycetaceae bacterium]|nr:aminotransferase class III-fold pyridoxal phosphate-dependent enzyme [Planctomycetaceae bacterium]
VAVRIARASTGRDKVALCGYHGWHDWYLAANLDADSSLSSHLFPGIEPIGVPRGLAGTAIPFPFGDAETLGELLDANRGEVAAVIMEPLRSEVPPEGYLEQVDRLAREHHALLIFDEVSTGFRPSAAGVQPVVNVTPDLAVFAKSISNGYPMGAVVGRREVMEPASRMFIYSTYWSDPIGLTAALITLQEVAQRDVPAHCHQLGRRLKTLIAEAAQATGCPITGAGVDYHPHLVFQIEDESRRQKASTLYIQEMAKRGCHGFPAFYLNAAQGEPEVEQTEQALRETFQIVANGLESDRLDNLLECDLPQEAFRRLVR